MNFINKIFRNGLSMGFQFGSRWGLNLVLATQLSNAEYGVFALILMVANLSTPAMSFGSNFFIIHNISKKNSRLVLFSSLLLTCVVAFIITLLATIISFLGSFIETPISSILIGLGIGFNWTIAQVFLSYMKGKSNFSSEMRIQILAAFFLLTFTYFIFIFKVENAFDISLSLYLISFVTVLISAISLKQDIHQEKIFIAKYPQKILTTQRVKERIVYAFHDILAFTFSNLPFIFMAIYASIDEFGIFRKIYVLIVPFTLIPVIISQVLLGRVSTISDRKAKMKAFKSVTTILSCLGIIVWGLSLMLAEDIFKLVLPNNYSEDNLFIFSLFLITTLIIYLRAFFDVLLTSLDAQKLRTQSLVVSLVLSCITFIIFSSGISGETAANIHMVFHSLLFIFILMVLPKAYKQYEG